MPTPSSSQSHDLSDLQKEVVATLRDFYTFLARLPWVEPDDVLEPPDGGWPDINADNFRPFGKSDEVIDLLRHLPYIRMDGPNGNYLFAWEVYPCDYRQKYFKQVHPSIDCWEIPDTTERGFAFPKWVVPLAYGKVKGDYIMLDTTDGTAWRYQPQWLHDPVYTNDDVRAWRNECANPGSTARLDDILDEWKHEYDSLRWIGFYRSTNPYIWAEDDGDEYKELKEMLLSYGWPDHFDRAKCRTAMLAWDEKKLSDRATRSS